MTPIPQPDSRFKLSRALAANVGKCARWLSRRLRRSGGTSFPGLLAERIDPSIVSSLGGVIPNGCILITGTNGKTTTTRIITDALRRAGLVPLTNREGSNMLRGLATTLLGHTDLQGNLKVPLNAIGVFEVDEGTLLPAMEVLRPRLVVITNLFRDQLDRYFEVDYVAHLWGRALRMLPASTPIVLNADDPQVAYLGEGLANPVVHYGLEDMRFARPGLEHASDSRRCLKCGVDLLYSSTFYAHLGHYACPRCGWRRPSPRVSAWKVELAGLEGSQAEATTPWGNQSFRIPLPGLYNVYNVLAAATGAFSLGLDASPIGEAVAQARPAFGRLERFGLGGKEVCLGLVKNPAGFNETLRLLFAEGQPKSLLLALNDNIPDGRDVSWIWDVDLELCRERTKFVIASGQRAHDMALRLKYAGLFAGEARAATELTIEEDVVKAFWLGLERTPPGETLYILPTYTAMWALREELARRGFIEPFWQR